MKRLMVILWPSFIVAGIGATSDPPGGANVAPISWTSTMAASSSSARISSKDSVVSSPLRSTIISWNSSPSLEKSTP